MGLLACNEAEVEPLTDAGAREDRDASTMLDPCDTETCSGHGECAVIAGTTARCICDANFHASGDGLSCTEIIAGDECRGIDCGGHGRCVVIDGEPRAPLCICDAGYHVGAGMTVCVPNECAGSSCAEPVSAIDGIVTRLAVASGMIYAALDTQIVAGPLTGPLVERFDDGDRIVALVTHGDDAYFVTPAGAVFHLQKSSEAPPSMIFRANALQWLSSDGGSLFCGTAASPSGVSNGETSYGHTLRCGSTSGLVESGGITASSSTGPFFGRMGTAFSDSAIFYSVGTAIYSVDKSNISERWDAARHTFATNLRVGDLATDGTYLYWVNESVSDFAVKRASISDRSVSTVAALAAATRLPALRIFVHSGYVYWGNAIGVWRVAVTGGSAERVATAGHLTAIARDENYLYFADQSEQAIVRFRLP